MATGSEPVRAVAAWIDGRLDLAFYCAGHYKALRATAFDLDEMLRHQQVNVCGAYHLLAGLG